MDLSSLYRDISTRTRKSTFASLFTNTLESISKPRSSSTPEVGEKKAKEKKSPKEETPFMMVRLSWILGGAEVGGGKKKRGCLTTSMMVIIAREGEGDEMKGGTRFRMKVVTSADIMVN